MTPRPVALPVVAASIPSVVTIELRFAVWRYEWRNERWAKVPYQARSPRVKAKCDDRATWCDFHTALEAYHRDALYYPGRFDGLLFALGDGWAAVDIDAYQHCPVWDQRFAAAGGYSERTPSGTGIRILGRSARIGGEFKFHTDPPTRTTWQAPRFVAVTGQHGVGDPADNITAFLIEHFPVAPQAPVSSREGYPDAALWSDDDLLLQMVGNYETGDAILALWRGDMRAYGDDHSRADLALLRHLAWWTNYDRDRVDRLFRQSGLFRPHWNTHSYRQATLGKALR